MKLIIIAAAISTIVCRGKVINNANTLEQFESTGGPHPVKVFNDPISGEQLIDEGGTEVTNEGFRSFHDFLMPEIGGNMFKDEFDI
jgi:hypothetical protein